MRPATARQLKFIASLRRELGIESEGEPRTSREASRLIEQLLLRSKWRDRATARPSIEVAESIRVVASRLGLEVDVPSSASEARFLLDDLYSRERAARRAERRVADGSAG